MPILLLELRVLIIRLLIFSCWICVPVFFILFIKSLFRKEPRKSAMRAACILLSLVTLAIFYCPQPAFFEDEVIDYVSVGNYDPKDTSFDAEGIGKVLSKYTCRRTIEPWSNYQRSEKMIELDGSDLSGPWHYVIDERYQFKYRSANTDWKVLIQDPDGTLVSDLLKCIDTELILNFPQLP